jgi:leucyl/phenylalanyl-tRNA--protein transferase
MALIQSLQPTEDFPPTSEALDYPNGLLAVGGDLTPERLLSAYGRGIFPWFEAPQPVLWWTPDPRSVLFPDDLHISRSLRKTLRRDAFELTVDRQFNRVIRACAEAREAGPGTWIDDAMIDAYTTLHRMGYAHSVEVAEDGELVGGLYGVAIGSAFFGESMFSRRTDASKVALVALVHLLKSAGFKLIDCQVESAHLNTLGASNISRLDFEHWLAQTRNEEPTGNVWVLPARCGALL